MRGAPWRGQAVKNPVTVKIVHIERGLQREEKTKVIIIIKGVWLRRTNSGTGALWTGQNSPGKGKKEMNPHTGGKNMIVIPIMRTRGLINYYLIQVSWTYKSGYA